MLSEMIEAARRFEGEGVLRPAATKPKSVEWVIELLPSGGYVLKGRFNKRNTLRQIEAPDRGRQGGISPNNLKPYLLFDRARYALGIPTGDASRDKLAHDSFLDLTRRAYKATDDQDVARVLAFLEEPLPSEIARQIKPADWVTFQLADEFLCERPTLQEFWAQHLAEELLTPIEASCAACGTTSRILRILPKEITIMGQSCQISSFNLPAFCSFGKDQTTNAPLCFDCATSAIQALDHLIAEDNHHVVVARDDARGEQRPLRNQLAIYWLKQPARHVLDGVEIDIEQALAGLLKVESTPAVGAPLPELAQLEELLRVMWTGHEQALQLRPNAFYLGVLSANKGRLVVREWLNVSVERLHISLTAFLAALRIVEPDGQQPSVFSLPTLASALAGTLIASSRASHARRLDQAALREGIPGLTRHLLRTAYLGVPPPGWLLPAALIRFSNPNALEASGNDQRTLHTLAAILKLVRTYGTEEATRMENLNRGDHKPAYLCGRLLAILEETQGRASRGSIGTTLVARFYGAASSSPARAFVPLLRLAETAHLPKIKRENRGYNQLKDLLEDVIRLFNPDEGMPSTLTYEQQADFALGFYHQRADFSKIKAELRKGESRNGRSR